MIRLTIPSIEQDDLDAARETLASGFLVQGPRVAAFERALGAEIGTEHVVAVTNCTAALELAMMALDVGPGDLVAVTAYSWIATANAIALRGAEPVFVDVDPATFNMDADALDARLTELRRVDHLARRLRAIVPVHAFGQMADVDALDAVAEKHGGLPIVEDAACALGARWGERRAGAASTMGCFSFHPRKAITTGEGGAIATNDASLARRLRALRNHGIDPDAPSTDFVMPGLNTRMTEMQAAIGTTQLTKLGRIVAARRRLATRYGERLRASSVTPPAVPAKSAPVYQSYVVLLPADAAPRRASIIARLRERGVETTIGTWHMPLTTYFRTRYGYRPGDFPHTDDVFARSMTLPLYESMTEAEVDEVVSKLLEELARG